MKKELRQIMQDKRNELSVDFVLDYSKRIVDEIRKNEYYINSKVVGIYYPMNNEIDLRFLLDDEKVFVFPKTKKKEMFFLKNNNQFIPHVFGTMVPNNNDVAENIDLIICPLLAYNKTFHRLGYGGGYYDRFLKDFKGKYIGVAFPFQYVENMSVDDYDIPLMEVICL